MKKKIIISFVILALLCQSIFIFKLIDKNNKYEKLLRNNDFSLIEGLYGNINKVDKINYKILAMNELNLKVINEGVFVSEDLSLMLRNIIYNSIKYRSVGQGPSIDSPKFDVFTSISICYKKIIDNAEKVPNYKLSKEELDNLKDISKVLQEIINVFNEYNVGNSLEFKMKVLTNNEWKNLISKIVAIFDTTDLLKNF